MSSSSQIPNLLSRGGPRLRGRDRGRGGASVPKASSRRDQNIQATDTDAAVSRLSAVSLGYLDDPFAQHFVSGSGTRRLPIINRGTYTRTTALDILINSFLSSNPAANTQLKQIISLGAGTDTRYFRLRAQNRHHNLVYHEFDFPAVCAVKHDILRLNGHTLCGNDDLCRYMVDTNGVAAAEPEWALQRSIEGQLQPRYFCHPLDLRELPSSQNLESFRGLRSNLPTLIISECCLCYLDTESASDVVKWFGDRIPNLGIILYEPIGANDSFGQMMVENLAARGIVMPTIQRYKTLEDQKERLAEFGFTGGNGGGGNIAETIEDIWETWIDEQERERLNNLEGLDEVEEWQMLARHYCVAWGWRGDTWENWARSK